MGSRAAGMRSSPYWLESVPYEMRHSAARLGSAASSCGVINRSTADAPAGRGWPPGAAHVPIASRKATTAIDRNLRFGMAMTSATVADHRVNGQREVRSQGVRALVRNGEEKAAFRPTATSC